ncbi:PAS domain S-box protein [Tamlana sp. 2_MG-2023]|uniref:sensor histidine kinase n=1 Tax=unclassified Tamlana TaxID=2614803 RepID=UPI0026E2D941|nr:MULTISPECIES: sensor histidine kinase [unclassified Tamlana]MDO6758612.1 PAS domain S-box protein [Tamlana sp. 2_MG-2023]MDO6789311.1 PAS domain S-box protein [Tamlana sp. 1_MG-2023]
MKKALFSQNNFPDTYDSLESIFNNTYNGIAILTLDGDWIKVNDSVCELFGYTRLELFNMNIENIIFREDLGVHQIKYDRLLQGKFDRYRVRQRYFHKDGSVIWVLISVSLILNADGTPGQMIWQFSDITNRKRNQDKLKLMLSVVREQNERLTAFADIITHNLRSHSGNLSTIKGFMEEEFSWLKGNENFELLSRAIGNLEDTVSHLTQVAKIKQVDSSEVKHLNLYDYVDKAIYTVAAFAKNTKATIINKVDEDLLIKGIPAYLDSIILNFLTNAIKYRDEERAAKIKLDAFKEGSFIILKITDNGKGIDLKKYGNKLFQMYKTFHSNKDAIGIGLFITKNHIESLGGKVMVESEVGVGSEFSIYFKSA